MDNKNEILDHPNLSQTSAEKLNRNPLRRSVLYLVSMFLGGVFFYSFEDYGQTLPRQERVIYIFIHSLKIMIWSISLSLVLEIFRLILRKWKEKKMREKEIRDPLWFEVLEGGMGIWVLFMIVFVLFWFFK